MKQIFAPFALCLTFALTAPVPLHAQDAQQDREEGLGLMERGMRLLFDGLLAEMEPAFDDMALALKDLEPMARELAGLIGDARYYEAPERLENGDIIIRRKAGAPPPTPIAPKQSVPDTNPPVDVPPKEQIDL